jgi:hypothetical protein
VIFRHNVLLDHLDELLAGGSNVLMRCEVIHGPAGGRLAVGDIILATVKFTSGWSAGPCRRKRADIEKTLCPSGPVALGRQDAGAQALVKAGQCHYCICGYVLKEARSVAPH